MSDDAVNEAPVADEAAAYVPDLAPTPLTGATVVLKRNGAETDISFTVNPPAIIGRFDPTVGPIDIDLGGLPEGSYVSRRHAKITLEDGVYTLHDMGSSNGTFVLGDHDFERQESFPLHDGLEFALGNARFVFHTSDVDAHAEPSEPPVMPTLDAEPVPAESEA